MRRRVHLRRLPAVALLVGLAAGCASDPTEGYSAQAAFPSQVSTVAVPIFTNETFTRDVEFELTDAVIKEIQARTPYRISSTATADSILLGRIRSVRLNQISASPKTGLGEEVIVSVSIDFQWKDLRTDASLVERESFAGHGLFVPSRPSGERIELGQFSAVQELARDIVAEMRSAW